MGTEATGGIQRVGGIKKTTYLYVVQVDIICILTICQFELHLFQLFSVIVCTYIAAGSRPSKIGLNQQAKLAQSGKVTVNFEPKIKFKNYIENKMS